MRGGGNGAAAAARTARSKRDSRSSHAGEGQRPRGRRIHALWTLDGLGLETADVVAALKDQHGGVRENAVRLAEPGGRLAGHPVTPARHGRRCRRPRPSEGGACARRSGRSQPSRHSPRSRAGMEPVVDARCDPELPEGSIERVPSRLRRIAASSPDVKAAVMQDLGQLFGVEQSPERCLDLIIQIAEPGRNSAGSPRAVAGVAQGLKPEGSAREDRSALMTLLAGDSRAGSSRQTARGAIVSRDRGHDARRQGRR